MRGLAVQPGRLQDDGDRHFVLRLGVGSGDDLGGQVDGPRGPDADRIDLRAELLGRLGRVGTGGLVEVAEHDQSGQAAGRIAVGQIGEGPAEVGHLAVGRKLLGDVLAVDRPEAAAQFERADALRRVEEEGLQAELLAELFQQVLVLLLHQCPQVFDAAAPLAGGRRRRFPGARCRGAERRLGCVSSMPTALSVAARTSGGRSSAMFMLSVPSKSSHRAGRLLHGS